MKTPRFVVALGVMIAALMILGVVTELALVMRDAVASETPKMRASPGDFKVLMVGDSVLGFLEKDPKGLAGRVKASAPAGISISEISAPALLTKKLSEQAHDLATSLRPDLVVLMIGKSDYDASLADAPRGVQNLRTVRLLQYVWGDLNLRFKRWTSEGELRASRKQRLDAAWATYAKLDCAHAIPMFESLLDERHDSPTDVPNGRALYDCYLRERSYANGVAYFSALAGKAVDGSSYRMYAGSLSVMASGDDPVLRKAAHGEIEKAIQSGDPRSAFKTKLWLAKADRDAKSFARILREMTAAENTTLDARTVENIRTVVREFTSNGSHVLLLQYPTDHLEIWTKNFKEFGDAVTFASIRSWLLELPDQEMVDAVDEDIEHLSSTGADKLAPKLLREIEALQKRK